MRRCSCADVRVSSDPHAPQIFSLRGTVSLRGMVSMGLAQGLWPTWQVTAKGAQLEQHAAPEYELTTTAPNRVFIHPQPPTLGLPIP
jgi:hypothetical protein